MENLISTIIKKRKEVYFLVTEKDLNTLRTSSLLGDLFVILASIFLGGYFAFDNPFALFTGIIFLFIAMGLYYFVFSQIKELKSSGEVKSLNTNSEMEKIPTIKSEQIKPIDEISKKKKLIITSASYGTIDRHKDITGKIKSMIKDNKLITFASNKIAGDPYKGVRKELLISYIYNGVDILKKYNEGDKIELP